MIDALLTRIGLSALPAPDADGLRALHRAFIARVPYEDLAVQLGETEPLDETALMARMCADGRGGYCFELNTVFAALLRACGFAVTHHQATVGADGPTNHMTLLVALDGERWLADVGLGEGFVEPLPFHQGVTRLGPFTFTLADEDEGTWWLGHHEWGTFDGFRMTEAPSSIADFDVHHDRLAHDPESVFLKTLIVQSPGEDRIVTLRSRTLSVVGPAVSEKRVVEDMDEFASVLRETFGVTIGGSRLERLWLRAVAQHDAFLAARA